MCNQTAKYARFTPPGNVIELAALVKHRKNSAWLTHNCGDSKDGPPRVEFACDDCFVQKMWDYDLRTRL